MTHLIDKRNITPENWCIGDYYQDQLGIWYKVMEIDYDGRVDTYFNFTTPFHLILPIEITENVLLRCGVNKNKYFELRISGNRYLLFVNTHTDHFQIFIKEDELVVALVLEKIYLHQLQHLFRILTQTELKIDA